MKPNCVNSSESSFVILTDAFSNLPGYLLKSLDIEIMPCTYYVDGEPVDYNGDIETFDSRRYYDGLREGKVVTTALVNVQSFLSYFRRYLEQGRDVLYVGLSSGVSGTFQAATMAAEELLEEFPGRKIRTVDSLGASLGVGVLTCRGADLRAEGKTLDETADALEQAKMGLCQFFTVGTLEYLRRSGRISTVTAAIGSMLNIKPLLYGDYEGHIVSCAKHRGRRKVIDAIVEKFQKLAVAGTRIAISHGDCLEEAQALADRVRGLGATGEIVLCPHEPFTGSHVGPGMLALYFFGTARNEA